LFVGWCHQLGDHRWWDRQIRTGDLLLAKPDRAGSSPATAGNDAGRARRGIVRDNPLGPVGTAVNGTVVARPARTTNVGTLRRWLQLSQRVRSVLGDHCIVARARRGSRQVAERYQLRSPTPLWRYVPVGRELRRPAKRPERWTCAIACLLGAHPNVILRGLTDRIRSRSR
jgi:hypothetical protein